MDSQGIQFPNLNQIIYLFFTRKSVYVCMDVGIYNDFFPVVNHVKTTERTNMGLRLYDVKSSVDGHRLLFFIPHIFPHFIPD